MPILRSLKYRERIPERMDDPTLPLAEHQHALAGLARINRISRPADSLWAELRTLASEVPSRPLRWLDVATGSGDLPVTLAQRAIQAQIPVEFAGCDVSEVAIAAANERAKANAVPVRFFIHDVLNSPLPTGYDVVSCSLFIHHLDESDAAHVLGQMYHAASRAIVVNDLVRSRFNYLAVWLASHALSRSSVVHFDGPSSVRGALTRAELQTLAERASVHQVSIRSRFPCRMILTARKPS